MTRWKVSEVARAAHVTVRTLHHYDEIGLLVPSERTDAGYRLYSRTDLERLQRILLYRELGFALEEIGPVLDDPAMDRRSALEGQRALLVEKRRRIEAVIRAVDRTLETMDREVSMSADEMFEGFVDLVDAPEAIRAQHREHAREAHERWGDTDPWRTSVRRAKTMTKQDWEGVRRETEAHEARMAELLAGGADPAGPEAMATAEAMRSLIDRWFYPCSHAFHAGLADMYEQDPRFRAHYDDRVSGLAAFVAAAIRANRDGAEGRAGT